MPNTTPGRLRTIPLFAELDDNTLLAIAEIASEVEVPAGQVMIRPYDPGLGMFVVEEGRVVVELSHGREVELGPGEFFGELALLDTEPSIAVAMLPVLARRLSEELRAR